MQDKTAAPTVCLQISGCTARESVVNYLIATSGGAGADSVDLVELVMAMEEEFELDEIPEEELTSLKTVGDCVRYLSTKLG